MLNRKICIKKLSLIFTFFTILLGTSSSNANACNKISDAPSNGIFTQDCINDILTNYITYHPNGFFVISANEENNVYVQGAREEDDTLYIEAVGPHYSSAVTPNVVHTLIKLGWGLPAEEEGNYNRIIEIDDIFNRKASELLYKTLDGYQIEQNSVALLYFMSDF